WQTKAATKRTSKAVVVAVRRAGRRNDLIPGKASAKITGGLLPRQRAGLANPHSTGRPGRREGVPFFAHYNIQTNVQRHVRACASGSQNRTAESSGEPKFRVIGRIHSSRNGDRISPRRILPRRA